jgi:UDP-N-acetylglucosamine 2-epimerase (non-hydrolysing)
MKIAFVIGTRPEIIKFAPVIIEFEKRKYNYFIIDTNQHKDYNMFQQYFKEFNLRKPKYKITKEFEIQPCKLELKKILKKEKPDYVFVQGDTDTAFAGVLAGYESGIKIIHRESGVRSFDRRMQEEKNRILIDKLSIIHFVPTKEAMANLKEENIDNCYLVGQTLVDAIDIILDHNPIGVNSILFTFHRKENLTIDILKKVFYNLEKLKSNIWFPCHPNTKKFIKNNFEYIPKNIILHKPFDYSELLATIKDAPLVITDSGGIQEEAGIIGTPCIVLRKTTDRPELCKIGASALIDPRTKEWKIPKFKKKWKHPYGENASKKICNILEKII